MDINGFCYKLWYIPFPTDPINLKLTECTHMVEVNVYAKFEVIWTKYNFMPHFRVFSYFETF